MIIGGIQKFTLIDFPGKIAAALFTRSCNFRCPYCHNPQLVLPRRYQLPLDNKEILDLLKLRYKKLDGVVISGGEPLLQEDLKGFLRKLKNIGYAVKLDTNGSRAAKLKQLIDQKLVDYIAMDIKAPFDSYSKIVRMPVNTDQIRKSMKIIRESNIDYEFRTTIVKELHDIDEIKAIAAILEPGDRYYLQNFIESRRVGHKDLIMKPFSREELSELKDYFTSKDIICFVR